MTARRRLLAAASAGLALTALAACEKPAPLVTVVSGGSSVHTEAAVFCFEEGQTLAEGGCAERAEGVPTLEVRPGEQVGVDVGKELTERGWRLTLADPNDPQGGQSLPTTQTGHYFKFTAPGIPENGSLLLTVRTVAGEEATGEWVFELVPKA